MSGCHWRAASDRLQLKDYNRKFENEVLPLKAYNWKIRAEVTGRLQLTFCDCRWRAGTERLRLKGWDKRVETEGLQLKRWALIFVAERIHTCRVKGYNLTLGAEVKGLQLKGWDWTVVSEGLQKTSFNWRVATKYLKTREVLRRKISNCLWLNGWGWVVANKKLQQTGCNCRLPTKYLQLKCWDWRDRQVAIKVLQLKSVGTEGYDLMVANEGLHKETINTLANTFINREKSGILHAVSKMRVLIHATTLPIFCIVVPTPLKSTNPLFLVKQHL